MADGTGSTLGSQERISQGTRIGVSIGASLDVEAKSMTRQVEYAPIKTRRIKHPCSDRGRGTRRGVGTHARQADNAQQELERDLEPATARDGHAFYDPCVPAGGIGRKAVRP